MINKNGSDMCQGWLHCFRKPEEVLPENYPKALISESDFADCLVNKPNPKIEKKYDFIYICHRDDLSNCSPDEWVAYNKNLTLAEKCLTIFVKKKILRDFLLVEKDVICLRHVQNYKLNLQIN